MAVHTHIDEIISYKANVISALANSPEVVALMLDKPNPDVNGEDGDIARRDIYDYDYIDETQLEAGSYILVDCDIVGRPTSTVKDLEVYIQVVVSKTIQKLDHKKFKGVMGNRCDNLARQIDLLLNGSRDYGIGRLTLVSVKSANVPASFTSKLLTYWIPDFARDRSIGIK